MNLNPYNDVGPTLVREGNDPAFLRSPFGMDLEAWQAWITDQGYSEQLAKDCMRFFHKNSPPPNLPNELLNQIQTWRDFYLNSNQIQLHTTIGDPFNPEDSTLKYVWKLNDGQLVESVQLNFFKGVTFCLSTQVGCGMGCTFCQTGRNGLGRHLLAQEIIEIYHRMQAKLAQDKTATPSIVFMGQGEPLHNFDEVKKSLKILMHPAGKAIGPRQITLSTVGLLSGLERISELPPINLAFSLHSPFQEQRAELIPVAKQNPLDEIKRLLQKVSLLPRQFIQIEYILLKNKNMTESHAMALKEWSKDLKCIFNLIPYNSTDTIFQGHHFERPTEAEIQQFQNNLVQLGLRTMLRKTKGHDDMAACGQLQARIKKLKN